jgi:hypothetical protein
MEAYQGFSFAAGFPAAVTITEAPARAMNWRRVMAFEEVFFDLTVQPWKMNLARINHEFPDRGSGEDKRCYQKLYLPLARFARDQPVSEAVLQDDLHVPVTSLAGD